MFRFSKLSLVFVFIAFILLSSSAFAYISTEDAIGFVTETNHYVKEGETPAINPSVTISSGNDDYWVIAILSGNTPVTYVAVKDAPTPEIPKSETLNRDLFRVAFVLSNFSERKQTLSQQNQWFFTLSNANSFSNLSRLLTNEKSELEIIRADLNDSALINELNSLDLELTTMSMLSSEISSDITSTINFENSYSLQPSTEDLSDFIERFSLESDNQDSLLYKINSLQQMASDYDSDVTSFKSSIIRSDLDSSKKNEFLTYLNPPDFLAVNTFTNILSNNKQALDLVFNSVSSQVQTFLGNFQTRIQLNNAYQKLYGYNEAIAGLSGKQNIDTLYDAVSDILNENNLQLWEERQSVLRLDSEWKSAKEQYDKGNYQEAIVFADKAINDVKIIYRSGKVAEVDENPIDFGLLQIILVVLVIALISAILYRNRHRFLGSFEKAGEYDYENYSSLEEDADDFKKRW